MFEETDIEEMVDQVYTRQERPRALSVVLAELAARNGGSITMACIRDALADRSLATFLVLTCLLNLVPFPPGSTLILGVPILIVAAQMIAGAKTVWLPKRFLAISMTEKTFNKMATNIVPRLRKLERVVRPCYWPFASARQAERFVGVIGLIFGLFVFIPLPFTNWVPALAGAICGIALSERDGVWLAIGASLGLISIIVISLGYYLGGMAVSGWVLG